MEKFHRKVQKKEYLKSSRRISYNLSSTSQSPAGLVFTFGCYHLGERLKRSRICPSASVTLALASLAASASAAMAL